VDPHHFDAVPDVDPDSTYHPDADPNLDFLCGSGCGSGSRFLFDADPDPTSHSDADSDPDPDPSFQIKDQTLEKVLNPLKSVQLWAHIRTFWLVIYKIDADPDFYLMQMGTPMWI
jgi:hypothetical protein